MTVSEDMTIDVVDDHDVPRGVIKRSQVLASHLNFRVVHLFLFNRRHELLIQQLSPARERHPQQWGSSVAGYLFAGEGYSQAVKRRLLQELGVHDVDLQDYGKTVMNDAGCQKFITLFVANCEGPFEYDRSHIANIEWASIGAITSDVASGARSFTPTFLHLLNWNHQRAAYRRLRLK